MQEHVEGEPPELEPFVRPVNEDTVDRHRPRGIHLAHRHCVVREETQLQHKRLKSSTNVGMDYPIDGETAGKFGESVEFIGSYAL